MDIYGIDFSSAPTARSPPVTSAAPSDARGASPSRASASRSTGRRLWAIVLTFAILGTTHVVARPALLRAEVKPAEEAALTAMCRDADP